MPGTIAPPDIELIIEDSHGGGGGGGRPPDGGDDGDDNDYDKQRRKQPASPRRFSTAIAIAMVSILMFFMALASAFLVLQDRKSTRLNSSHSSISYAVFCLKKKKTDDRSSLSTLK